MKKVNDFHGDEALDVVGILISAGTEIFANTELLKLYNTNKSAFVKKLIKDYKPIVFEVLTALDGDGCTVNEYKERSTPFSIMKCFMELLQDQDALTAFQLGQNED